PAALALALALAACGGSNGSPSSPPDPPGEATPVEVPARGSAATFDVATWNVEWFGDPGNGPDDEGLQLQRVREVVSGADLDLWGVQEVVAEAAFATLVAGLPGYAGFLANASSVEGGAAWYSDFGDQEQKVGLIYKASAVEVLGARIILTEQDHAFAGRPPLEVQVRLTLGSAPLEAVVVVLHAKAGAAVEDWERRRVAAQALRSYLDATWPDAPVWVIGDFNDDVDTSIVTGRATPYASFLEAGSGWAFPTMALSQAGTPSTVGYADVIDHHLVSDEVLALYQAGSAEAYLLNAIVPRYGETTSDHYPVLARYGVN
ncbi:MAG TPA: endonuclease/exonuclease/phosphatase family protein, partial [Longimicrobiales bacterium]|nr:endonuclease/exonuclease/phosphatase family protein [Longimicrobiales bacterium]